MDLFDAVVSTAQGLPAPAAGAPLAVRMRPRTLAEVAGQGHLLVAGSPLRRLVEPADEASRRAAPSSVILWGPPGTGKTTLAYLVASTSGRRFVELSAVTAGVKDVRAVVEDARRRLASDGSETVLFIDEVHRFTKAQQDALLPSVENRWVTLVAATTENPSFSVNSPLLSRSLLLTLQPLTTDDVRALVERAVRDERGLAGSVALDDDALDHLLRLAGGDARKALTILEAAAGAALGDRGPAADDATPATVDLATMERAIDVAAVRYDRDGDQHYDVISAFIKSVRGSDVDASLHYLARMIAAGEDPRFIARRIVISAAEDVGMADPSALQTAVAAAQAVALIGMPEARIILAEAVVHLATAPKSNAAYLGIDRALADVRAGRIGSVPPHLRDAHYAGAQGLGHGKGYRYAHDEPHAVATQQYLPDELAGTRYYEPSDRGFERSVGERLTRIRSILDPGTRPGPGTSGG
ncbi:replication-associated recombination protein A [Cellulomonas sp. zg-ZUI222]|uniref:Replication-associated recombination protein A n=1 Tax=Cellulomonas wangleii TaxID=2816956 RepID=A0ABX8D955_9CELL|nr:MULTISPECIES: replication-associated recombination protein A [Cellulomonas]MBO0900386.1 replication-associated recombination protein A [Cellulomonas sp. zg-ZUI22]MBO0922784.1 replication-associated recombination protein A [Cellulomonas wangleii]MBO0926351.1 replication-associated recombination protein A [Cellulomonas wangleii]QVI63965.1 replication-associated recombination protein A [Cellulomonas wangleii]